MWGFWLLLPVFGLHLHSASVLIDPQFLGTLIFSFARLGRFEGGSCVERFPVSVFIFSWFVAGCRRHLLGGGRDVS